MKKLYLIAFLLLWADAVLSAVSIDLYGAASVKADLQESSGKSDEKAVRLESAVGGVKISVPFFSGQFYWNGDDFSYGAAFSSERLNKTFPVQAKWGKLSAGGGLSKLNNPLVSSSVSPFSSATSTITPITANLSSSFNKTDTFFFQTEYKCQKSKGDSGKGILQNVVLNCYYDPNGRMFSPYGNVAASSLASFNLPNKMKLSAECTFGSFVYDSMKSNSWYNDGPFYHEGRQNSAIGQVLFSGNNFSTIFTGGFYASPFGDLKTIFKTENKIKIKNSTIGVSALYNPSHNLMTSSGKVIDECLQGKLSFQNQFRNGKKFPLFWKTGVAGFYERKLTKDEDEFKLALGLQMLCFITSVSIVGQGDFSIISPVDGTSSLGGQTGGKSNQKMQSGDAVQFTKGTITLKNQWYFSAIQPGIKLSASFTPSSNYSAWKTSENCTLYLSFCENPAVSLQSGVTFNQKDGTSTGTKIDVSGTVKFKWKWLQCTGKVSVNLTS